MGKSDESAEGISGGGGRREVKKRRWRRTRNGGFIDANSSVISYLKAFFRNF